MGMPPDPSKKGDIHSEETVLFLFLTFGILIVLMLILLLLGFQSYLSWRIANLLLDSPLAGEDEETGGSGGWGGMKGVKRWERERRKALKALEKRGSVRGSWGYGSESRGTTRVDEETGMSGARGSSVLLDRMSIKDGEKQPFWSLKRWF